MENTWKLQKSETLEREESDRKAFKLNTNKTSKQEDKRKKKKKTLQKRGWNGKDENGNIM